MQEGTTIDGATEEGSARKEEELEKEVWRCLNSVHHLLRRREILDHTLRQGWMELVSARYEMGPARISHPLFSLRPQASGAAVDISLHLAGGDSDAIPEGECSKALSIKGPVVFDLIKDISEKGQKVATDARKNYSNYSKRSKSQLRRRPVSNLADDEKEQLLDYSDLLHDSDSEDELEPLEVQKNSFQGFGAIVSPHLRSAQTTFFKALQLVVELLNAQSEAMDAHSKVASLQVSTDTSGGREDP